MDEIAGVGFPFRIDPDTGGVEWARGGDKLRQNIRLILGVGQGERPMLRDFGTVLHSLLQDPNDAALAQLLQKHIQEALLVWEPRVVVTSARVQRHEGEIELLLTYRHLDSPRVDELLIPLV